MKDLSLDMLAPDISSALPLPFAESGVQAGFPSPAQDYIAESFDLNREIVRHPAATFYARVHGDSMCDDGDLTVCCIDGEFTLKRIQFRPGAVWLIPSNEQFDPILVTPDKQFEVWGVVTHTIKNNRRQG